MQRRSDTLLILPAYNEASTLPGLIQEIRSSLSDLDILVINDGSTDNTAEICQKNRVDCIDLPYNLGIGGAVQTGLQFARDLDYPAAVQIDSDGQHDPRYVGDLLTALRGAKADLVIGSRFLGPAKGFQSTAARRVGISFFSALLGLLTGIPVHDPTSGFRAFNRRSIEIFAENYPIDFPEPESLLLARFFGLRTLEVPVLMRPRQGGASSIRSFKTLYYMVKVTLAIGIDLFKNYKQGAQS
ncbi:MAG: glycosyltransferase family 2 protein [Candidatus Omnitrophota bacterium]